MKLKPAGLFLLMACFCAQAAEAGDDQTVTVDLTQPFRTVSKWAFVAVTTPWAEEEPGYQDWDDPPTRSCYQMQKNGSPERISACLPTSDDKSLPFADALEVHFDSAEIVQVAGGVPLLLILTHGQPGMNGNRLRSTVLLAYDRKADQFHAILKVGVARNNNQQIRFMPTGPLAGAVIVSEPAVFEHGPRPYAYEIIVYATKDGRSYSQALRYRSITSYGDGNRLAVIDAEMPEILRQLGLWKAGMPLPLPESLPQGCDGVQLKKGIEWCQ